VNRFPFWLAWIWPPPTYTVHQPRISDYFYRWLPVILPMYLVATLALLGLFGFTILWTLAEANAPGGAMLAVLIGMIVAAALLVFRLPPWLFFSRKRRRLRWRKRLSAILSVHYNLAPGGLGMLLEDDERFGFYVQRFLADHHVPHVTPLCDRRGRYLFAAPEKIKTLSAALLRAVAKSHDNELFVLLADLLELSDELQPLIQAVKVALARHHRVIVICPWPPGIPAPTTEADSPTFPKTKRMPETLRELTTARFHRAYRKIRRTFARLAVPVVCAQSGEPARIVLDHLEMLRDVRIRR
jgi:hypothetical protein